MAVVPQAKHKYMWWAMLSIPLLVGVVLIYLYITDTYTEEGTKTLIYRNNKYLYGGAGMLIVWVVVVTSYTYKNYGSSMAAKVGGGLAIAMALASTAGYIFVQNTPLCPPGQFYDPELKGCRVPCGTDQIYDYKTNTCIKGCNASSDCDSGEECISGSCCVSGDVCQTISGPICCHGGSSTCTKDPDNSTNHICCDSEQTCPQQDGSTICCGGGTTCVKESGQLYGTCQAMCGIVACESGQTCVKIENASASTIAQIKASGESDIQVDGSTVYFCADIDNLCGTSNEFASPSSIASIYPCMNIDKFSTSSTGLGFCGPSDPSDTTVAGQCYSSSETDCSTAVNGQCKWYDVLSEMAGGQQSANDLNLAIQSVTGEYSGYYCDPTDSGQMSMSRGVGVQLQSPSANSYLSNIRGFSLGIDQACSWKDCLARMATTGVTDIQWDPTTGYCTALQNCNGEGGMSSNVPSSEVYTPSTGNIPWTDQFPACSSSQATTNCNQIIAQSGNAYYCDPGSDGGVVKAVDDIPCKYGTVNPVTKQCVCDPGFTGSDCSQAYNVQYCGPDVCNMTAICQNNPSCNSTVVCPFGTKLSLQSGSSSYPVNDGSGCWIQYGGVTTGSGPCTYTSTSPLGTESVTVSQDFCVYNSTVTTSGGSNVRVTSPSTSGVVGTVLIGPKGGNAGC